MLRTPGSHAGRRGVTAAAAAMLVVGLLLPAAAAAAAPTGASGQAIPVTYLGLTSASPVATDVPTSGVPNPSDATTVEIRADLGEHSPKIPGPGGPGSHGAGLGSPHPPANPLAGSNPGFFGFNALSHYDTRTTNGGNQFSVEPPDQGLCVGNGYVVETINDVVAVYHASGSLGSGPTGINLFYGYSAEFIRPDGPFGESLTDPRCLYDRDTNRFFMTVIAFDTDPSTGDLTGNSHVDILVSETGDPTGAWQRFSFNTTDDGTHHTPNHPDCPCYGDQPLLGADATGLFVSTNEFPIFADGFNGAQIYALDKWALAAGHASKAIHFEGGPLAEGVAYSVSPATASGANATANGGTEYFLSALQFGPSQFDDRIAVWALTNTKSLHTAHPSLHLTHRVIHSEVYGQPDAATQKLGPVGSRPLGESLGEPQELVESNDDRMTQVVYANGTLWSALNTAIGAHGERVGIAWFKVIPTWHNGAVDGTVASQGYVSLAHDDVLFPSIWVNAAGRAVMALSVMGPHFYPSAGYLTLVGSGAGSVHVAAAGVGPEDGFSGYVAYGGAGIARWGDYTAAVADGAGRIWVAAAYIPAGPRTTLADWGTFIGRVTP